MRPYPIPQPWQLNEPLKGNSGYIFGFGAKRTEPFEFTESILRAYQVVISDEQCRVMLGTRSHLLTQTHYCALDMIEFSSLCIGDIGNGMVFPDPVDHLYHVLGVASVVTSMCRSQFPQLYTRVSLFTDWIERTSEALENSH